MQPPANADEEVPVLIAGGSPRQAVQKAKDIRGAVEKELEFDPLVDASDISVKNMNGDVALRWR
jgi:hypothetical protein